MQETHVIRQYSFHGEEKADDYIEIDVEPIDNRPFVEKSLSEQANTEKRIKNGEHFVVDEMERVDGDHIRRRNNFWAILAKYVTI